MVYLTSLEVRSGPAESGLNATVGAFIFLLFRSREWPLFVPPGANDPASPGAGSHRDEWSAFMSGITSKVSVAVILALTAVAATGCSPVMSLIAVTT